MAALTKTRAAGVATKGKNRKENGKRTQPAEVRPEPGRGKDEGMSDDIVREFLVENNEGLDLLDRELVILEKEPGNRETLSSIFRTVHTIKGTKMPIRLRPRFLP